MFRRTINIKTFVMNGDCVQTLGYCAETVADGPVFSWISFALS
jgi:hypothetical protein